MTDDKGLGPGARHATRPPYPMIVWGVLRIVGSIAVLVTLYYLLPLTHSSLAAAVTILVIGVAVFIGLVAFQVRAIIRSPFPGLRGIEAPPLRRAPHHFVRPGHLACGGLTWTSKAS